MNKIWLIAANTYHPRVRSGSFLFLTLFLPILMVAAGAVAVIFFENEVELGVVGYVDQTGRLAEVSNINAGGTEFDLVRLNDVKQAQSALSSGQIEAYLVIPQGYFTGEPVIFYGETTPGAELRQALERFLRLALWPEAPEAIMARAENPAEVTFVSLSTGTEISSGLGLVVFFATPAILAILFAIAVAFTTGQMGSAVVREKEQRAMEMVITSLRPRDLVAGKVLGMSLLALTQFGIWIAGALIALLIYTSGEADLRGLVFPWRAALWGLLLITPGYLLFAVLGAGVGLIAGDNQQAQQLAGLLGILGFVPMWFTAAWINQPDGAAAVTLTLFPLTAAVTALLRMAFTEVPVWQLSASFVLLVLSLWLAIWVVARIFRVTMLVYGQAIRPRQIWLALRRA